MPQRNIYVEFGRSWLGGREIEDQIYLFHFLSGDEILQIDFYHIFALDPHIVVIRMDADFENNHHRQWQQQHKSAPVSQISDYKQYTSLSQPAEAGFQKQPTATQKKSLM
jgi:hypothetical protein